MIYPNASWRDIPTPALILDVAALDRNVARAVERTRSAGISLRPHAKAFKSATIARRLSSFGASGFCCAKVGEIEALHDQGIDDFLLTSPVAADQAIERLIGLRKRGAKISVAVDDATLISKLSIAAIAASVTIDIVIDVNVGQGRTGAELQNVAALASEVRSSAALRLTGLQGYAGHNQHIESPEGRRVATGQAGEMLRAAHASCGRFEALVLTGGGTGSFDTDNELGVLDEVQPGSFLFLDQQYAGLADQERGSTGFEASLFVLTTVISVARPTLVVTDAGFKAFGTDAGLPTVVDTVGAPVPYFWLGDEHGAVLRGDLPSLALGDQLLCHVPHCDTTVDRYDHFVTIVDGRPEQRWPIEARGKSQ